MSERFVVLGGGVAAGYAAQEFVEQGVESGQVTIVSAEDHVPYDRPPLSKDFLAGETAVEDILINPPAFYEEHGINLLLNTSVKSVNLRNRMLIAESGEMIGFDKLIIATGSRLKKLDIPGADAEGIYYLRSIEHAKAISRARENNGRVVVIGGGYIGMETSAVFKQDGLEVHLVFPDQRLMEDFYTPDMSSFFENYYQDQGIIFHKGTKPARFVTNNGRISAVELEDSSTIETDFVVVGIGVEPRVDLFEQTGIPIDNGIIVNKYLETNRAGIYAAGDVANYYDIIFDKRRRLEHWQNAVDQGRHVAADIMSNKRKRRDHFVSIPYFFSDIFDLSYEFWGDTDRAEEVVYRGRPSDEDFMAFWLRYNRMIGAFVMNGSDEAREYIPTWIRERRGVSGEHLANRDVDFDRLNRLR